MVCDRSFQTLDETASELSAPTDGEMVTAVGPVSGAFYLTRALSVAYFFCERESKHFYSRGTRARLEGPQDYPAVQS